MTIGRCKLQTTFFHLEVNAGKDLLGLVTTAGKQGAAQTFGKGFTAEQQGLAVLSERQIGEILSR